MLGELREHYELACVAVRYLVSVTVHENIEESAPVHVQSLVMCQPLATVMAGALVSLVDQNVACTVWTPAVESLATGSPLMVVGSSVTDASNSDDCRARLADSVKVNAPNVRAWRAGERARVMSLF